jgi:hypothetical protein
MAKYIRKLKPEFEEKRKELEEFKIPELKSLCEDYNIPATGTKEDLVKRIGEYENDKWVGPVQYTTSEPEDKRVPKMLFIGVHKNDRDSMMKVNKFVLSGEAKFHHYASDYYFYLTNERIKLI